MLQDYELKSQVAKINAAEQLELWLVDTQPGLKDAHLMNDHLTAELDDVRRDRSDQSSNLTCQLEYMTRVITQLTGAMCMNGTHQQNH